MKKIRTSKTDTLYQVIPKGSEGIGDQGHDGCIRVEVELVKGEHYKTKEPYKHVNIRLDGEHTDGYSVDKVKIEGLAVKDAVKIDMLIAGLQEAKKKLGLK